MIILAAVLFFYSALEISTAGWIRTFLEKEVNVAPENSRIILTTFWVMMMLGRLLASQIVRKVRGPQLVWACSAGAITGLLLMALAPNVWIATTGIIICGLSYAPVFPTTAGTASTYFARLFGTVFGMLMTLALLSGAVVPPGIGYVAQHQSLRAGIWILVGAAVLLLMTQGIFNRYERRKLLAPAAGLP